MKRLHAVGYWNHDAWPITTPPPPVLVNLTAGFPDPRRLVEALGPRVADERVLAYLKSGHPRMHFLGMSYCRFGCRFVPGTACLTDGAWVWPEGLSHYVEVHQVPLPEEFLDTMRSNWWHASRQIGAQWDSAFWVEWSRRVLNRLPNASD